jgi:hypothetical protein
VVLEGEHDLSTLPALESALQQAMGGGSPVIVDLSACTYVDCATIGAITGAPTASPVAIFVADTAALIVRRVLEVLDATPARARRSDHAEATENLDYDRLWCGLLRVLFQAALFDSGSLYVLAESGKGHDSMTAEQPERSERDEPSSTSPAALMVRAAGARSQAAEYRRAHLARVAHFERLRDECALTRAASGLATAECDAKLHEYRRARKEFDQALARLQAVWSQPARAGRRWLQGVRSRTAGHTAGGVRRRRVPAGLH